MKKESYYVDSCVYLNIWLKEGDERKGIPYWELSKNFLEKISLSKNKEIIYSGFILKELRFKINDESLFSQKVSLFKKEK